MSTDSAPSSQEASSTPVVSGSKRTGRGKVYGRVIVLVVVCLLILAGAAYGGSLAWRHFPNKTVPVPLLGKSVPHSAAPSPIRQARDAAAVGNYTKAQSILDQQLKTANTDPERLDLYSNKMAAALNAGDYTNVIAYGQQAETLGKSEDTAMMMYRAYLAQGNKTEAKQWVQTAIDRLDKSSSLYERTADELYGDLQELGT